MIASMVNLMIVTTLMNFVTTIPYDLENYNCYHHSVLLVDLLRENGVEAYYRSGYTDWDRYTGEEKLECWKTLITQIISSPEPVIIADPDRICDYKCCHAWVDVVLFGRNWTIESTTGEFVNPDSYTPLDFQEEWIADPENFRREAERIYENFNCRCLKDWGGHDIGSEQKKGKGILP